MMSTHPYQGLADHQFWRRAVAGVEPFNLDPVTATRFRIGRNQRVATAGSCSSTILSPRRAMNWRPSNARP